MSLMKIAVCDKINTEAERILKTLEGLKAQLDAKLAELDTFLKAISFSPRELIDQNINKLRQNAESMIPDLGDFTDVVNTINACTFLNADPALKNPTALAKTTLGNLTDYSKNKIAELTDNLPEFNAAKMFNELKKQLIISGFNTNLSGIKGALDCLNALCGLDVQSKVDRLNSLLESCYLDGTGNFDPDKLMEAAGLGEEDIDLLNNCSYAVDTIIDGVEESINNGVQSLKNTGASAVNRASQLKTKLETFDPF